MQSLETTQAYWVYIDAYIVKYGSSPLLSRADGLCGVAYDVGADAGGAHSTKGVINVGIVANATYAAMGRHQFNAMGDSLDKSTEEVFEVCAISEQKIQGL